jgi:hypothetical protein
MDTGASVFTNIADGIMNVYSSIEIDKDRWQDWQNQWLFDKIGGKRCGQSFCEYFGLSIYSPLYHFRCDQFSMKWIRERYEPK